MASFQVAASQFDANGQGHMFHLRKPLAKVTAKKCAECAKDVYMHSVAEVSDSDLQTILNVVADNRATMVDPAGLHVGGFKAALTECKRDVNMHCLNTAGFLLHDFLPKTRAPFDALRATGRVYDLEWQDRDDFEITPADLVAALLWVHGILERGGSVVVNCAQGKSRSGTAATAYVMARHNLNWTAALAQVKQARPFVAPNPGFLRQLEAMEPEIRACLGGFQKEKEEKKGERGGDGGGRGGRGEGAQVVAPDSAPEPAHPPSETKTPTTGETIATGVVVDVPPPAATALSPVPNTTRGD